MPNRGDVITGADALEIKQYVKKAAGRIAKLEKQLEFLANAKNWKHDWSRSGKQKWTWKGDNSPTVGARELLKESWNKR